MANYKKSTGVTGSFVDKTILKNGQRAKIMTETEPVPSAKFTDNNGQPQIQNLTKVKFEGQQDAVNVNLNRANLNALVDAFGEDSKLWIGQSLTVEIEKVRVGGRAVLAMYLLPAGYVKIDNADGFAEIIKDADSAVKAPSKVQTSNVVDDEDEAPVTAKDLPF